MRIVRYKGLWWSCVLWSSFLLPLPASADFLDGITSYPRYFLPAETFLDNTLKATERLKIPGWINSGGEFKQGFGVAFKTGSSTYAIKRVTLLVSCLEGQFPFTGDFEVDFYAVADGGALPEKEPIRRARIQGKSIGQKPEYLQLDLDPVVLEGERWYAIVLSAPNTEVARIWGYQVPDVAPQGSGGFVSGKSFWTNAPGSWKHIQNPYIWVEGYDLSRPLEIGQFKEPILLILVSFVGLGIARGVWVRRGGRPRRM